MRTPLLALLAGCLLAPTAPAQAEPVLDTVIVLDLAIDDGCAFVGIKDPFLTGGSNTFTGVLVLAGPTNHCEVQVDGVNRGEADPLVTLLGIAIGAEQVSFDATDSQDIDVVSMSRRDATTTARVLPRPITDELSKLDPVLCDVLGQLAPGVPGVLDISSSGDVTLAGAVLIWDCPPYRPLA